MEKTAPQAAAGSAFAFDVAAAVTCALLQLAERKPSRANAERLAVEIGMN